MSRHVQQLMAAQLAMSIESLAADAAQLDTYLDEVAGSVAALESIDQSLAALATGNLGDTAALESHVDTYLAEAQLTVSTESGVADKLKTAGEAILKKLKELVAWIVDLFKKIYGKISAWINALQPKLKKLKLKAKDLADRGGEVSFEVSQETANWVRDPKVMGRSFLILAPGKTAIDGLAQSAEKLAKSADLTGNVLNSHSLWLALQQLVTHYHGRLLPLDAYQNYELSSETPDVTLAIDEQVREASAKLKIKPSYAEAYPSTRYTVPVRLVLHSLDEVEKHLGPWEAEIKRINASIEQSLQAAKQLAANPHKFDHAPLAQLHVKTTLAVMQLIQKLSHTVQVGILAQRSFTEHHLKWLDAAFAAAK